MITNCLDINKANRANSGLNAPGGWGLDYDNASGGFTGNGLAGGNEENCDTLGASDTNYQQSWPYTTAAVNCHRRGGPTNAPGWNHVTPW
jgi:hypothetical protein